MYFIVIACLVATASAANFCCTPDQWEGRIGLVMGSRQNGVGSFIQGTMAMAYDAVHKIVMTNQSLIVDGAPVQQRIVSDFKNSLVYTITPSSCSKQSLGLWMPYCIPDNATVGTNSRYGLGSESLPVKTYFIDYVNFQVYMSVTADTCVPVAEDVLGHFGDSDVLQNMIFVNIKPGIADRSVFQVPAQCDDAPLFNAGSTMIGRRSSYF